MDERAAIAVLSALGQPARLAAVRHLLAAWPQAVRAGVLAQACGLQQSALSPHLAILARARLVQFERVGNTVNYRVDAAALRGLMAFLAKDCCGDRGDLCGGFAGVAAREPEPSRQRTVQPALNVLFVGARNA